MFPEVTVDIDVFPCHSESASTTVEIDLKRERDDGPPFPDTHLILNNVVSFDPHKIQDVLHSTFQDNLLCGHLCTEIAFASQRVPAPFNMYLHVTQRIIGASSPLPTQDNETCAICLEDISEEVQNFQQMAYCPHEFHDYCIYRWLSKSNSCPVCHTVLLLEDDFDDHPYYCETES
ncbi:PREDICTED: uncharacterized protein LOC104704492 [Camelina sativa]|uniref:Uncharacterized protein LOC104704492 n=1 Tax=Camelina sativa TaxID=90675 RepID=A0ABM0T0F0_CAMSA|nr:PREDICTED: uncharacterized protein LOC104704492 [Camelina sativa]